MYDFRTKCKGIRAKIIMYCDVFPGNDYPGHKKSRTAYAVRLCIIA